MLPSTLCIIILQKNYLELDNREKYDSRKKNLSLTLVWVGSVRKEKKI